MEFNDAIIFIPHMLKIKWPLKALRNITYFKIKKRQMIKNFKCISTLPFHAFHVIRDFSYYNNTNDMLFNIQGYIRMTYSKTQLIS